MWASKNGCYERPYAITGRIKAAGLEKTPKLVCKDSIIGTWEVVSISKEMFVLEYITILNNNGSEGVVPVKQ